MNNKKKALIYILISTFAFSVMGAFVKYLHDTPIYEKVFFRNLISLFVAAYVLLHRSHKSKIKIRILGSLKNQKYLILRSTFGFFGVILNFYAITHLYLADAQILNRTSPFFVSIFAAFFLKEKLGKVNVYTLILASIGAIFVIKPSFDIAIIPGLAAIASAILAGSAYTMVRFLKDKENPETIVLYFSLFSVLGSLPFVVKTISIPNTITLFALLGTGIAASFGQIGLTYAYKYAKASEVSIYTYSGIIFSALIGFFMWGEIPDAFSLFGGVVIIISAIILYISKRKVSS